MCFPSFFSFLPSFLLSFLPSFILSFLSEGRKWDSGKLGNFPKATLLAKIKDTSSSLTNGTTHAVRHHLVQHSSKQGAWANGSSDVFRNFIRMWRTEERCHVSFMAISIHPAQEKTSGKQGRNPRSIIRQKTHD
jgi:hypothetical protein